MDFADFDSGILKRGESRFSAVQIQPQNGSSRN